MNRLGKFFVKKHDSRRKWINTILLSSLIVLISFSLFALGNYAATKGIFIMNVSDDVKNTAQQINDVDKYSALFEVRKSLIEKYDGEIDDDKLLESAIRGMTSSLDDPYTVFMNSAEYEKFIKKSQGSMNGIGVTVADVDDKITVLSVVKDSPAEKAGIAEKDVIEKINDTEYTGDELSDAVNAIKDNSGIEINLTLVRNGSDSFNVSVMPQQVKLSVVDGSMVNSSVGYIRIKSFMNENTTEDFVNEINVLKDQGMKGLILDLRENPGGLLSQGVGVASQFVEKNKIITYTIDKYGNRNDSLSVGGITEGLPLVVLVNNNSASASEVVTGALRDYNAATIIGTTTFGKGIVQQTIKFNSGIGALKVTTSKYYTPDGENIHKKGITPDYEVTTPLGIDESGYSKETDSQLNLAIEKISEKIQ